tara:strand:- start:44 stop:835 length:792 start_codon:yes stop_codon:yes gene_type:complete
MPKTLKGIQHKEDKSTDLDYYDLPSNVNNKGFVYEEYIFELLKDQNLVPAGFVPAGADNSAPDCKFLWNGKPYNLEIKLDEKADYGQSGLKYNVSTKKWFLDGKNTVQDKTMRENLKQLGVEGFVNSKDAWGGAGVPRLFQRKSKNEKVTWGDKEYDYKTFPDKYIPIDTNTLSSFYNSKKIYYIHIGGYGTYYMGQDPAGMSRFTEIRKFNGTLKLRIRKKGSSSSPNYRFSTALLIDKKPTKSAFDITQSDSLDFLIANMT